MTGILSQKAADREALQRAAKILLRTGLTLEAEALNATIEARFPKPPALGAHVYTHSACSFDRCPVPGRCMPIGCIQHPHAEHQPELELEPEVAHA